MRKNNYNLQVLILLICLVVFVILLILFEKNEQIKLTPAEKEIIAFQRCVNETGLVLYGRTNSQVFLAQKEELGMFFDFVPFVDCLDDRESCMGIILLPAWRLNDQVYYGSFSKDILIKLMECE